MIKLKQINKYYNKGKENEIHVIHDVNLELPNTGLVSFLGPSGSGKTTLLNVIGGLDKAKGSISYDEIEIEKYKMNKVDKIRSQQIGYVFQNYNLLLEETVYSNLAIALEMIGIYDEEEQSKRIEYTLKAVGMYKYRKKRAYALSGGQQQRVSIARALVKQAKIIIADEPTGNLDSENTIEVMNILKKISKSSLVLMVTHNEEVANFYSDQVIRIKDGAILDRYMCDENQTLQTEQGNTIYLKDLSYKEEKGELVSLQYYASSEAKPLEIRIIEKNGTYYISGSEKLKLLEETNLKVLDQHYEALKQEHIEQFEYDTSWYKDTTRKENPFKKFGKAILKSFNKMRFAKKRAKFLYFAFGIIGVLLAICTIGFANYVIVDETHISLDEAYYQLESNKILSDTTISSQFEKMINNESIESISSIKFIQAQFSKKINFSESILYSFEIPLIGYYEANHVQLLCGQEPAVEEIILSKKLADQFIKKNTYYYPTYDSLLGIELQLYQGGAVTKVKVSGISDNPHNFGYLNDATYMKMNASSWQQVSSNQRLYSIEKKYNTYNILEGRDLTETDLESNNILLSSKYPNAIDKLDQNVILADNKTYHVVGIFEFVDGNTIADNFIIHQNKLDRAFTYFKDRCFTYEEYKLVEGRLPEKDTECIVSVYCSNEIGDNLDGIEIVGKYYAENTTLGFGALFTRTRVILSMNYNGGITFKVKDIGKINEVLEEKFYVVNSYEHIIKGLKEDQYTSLLVFGILSLALIVTISIFIYFIMRSRMISDIYPIGVYRSLGASKFKLFLQFISDIFVMVTLTSLLGYIFTTIIFDTIAANINNTLSMNALKSSIWISILGALLLYLLNFIFGLLPIVMLMRKIPAEIISKYDI